MRCLASLLTLAVVLSPAADAGWKLKSGKTRAVSVPAGGPPLDTHISNLASISGNGRIVCFRTDVAALTGHLDYPVSQLVAKDRMTGAVQLVSATTAGAPAGHTPLIPVISSDGQYVVFSSRASDLPDGISVADVLGHHDVFRTHLPTGTTIRVSVTHDSKEPDDDCLATDVSEDGRYVLFTSTATNLLPDAFAGPKQVYRVDLNSFALERASINDAGTPADDDCDEARLSESGREVVFRTSAANLGVVPIGGAIEIWLRDMDTGILEFVSAKKNGGASDEGGDRPAITGDGRFVAFTSRSTDLPGAEKGNVPGMFVRDRKKGKTFRAPMKGKKLFSTTPHDASDGRYVTFTVDSAKGFRVFVWDLKKNSVKAVGLNSKGKKANASAHRAAISRNGKIVAFDSKATNLGQDSDDADDVFVRRWK